MPDQFRMPVPVSDAAAAVIAEAEETVRSALARESRRVRRAGRKARAAQRLLADRARRAERAADRHRTDGQRRLARAEKARQELAGHARRLAEASGGSILECFRTVADPRDPRGVRYALASVLALVTAAMLADCETLADIVAWISHASREKLETLGCPALPGRAAGRALRQDHHPGPGPGQPPGAVPGRRRLAREGRAAAPGHLPRRRAGHAPAGQLRRQGSPRRPPPRRQQPVPAVGRARRRRPPHRRRRDRPRRPGNTRKD